MRQLTIILLISIGLGSCKKTEDNTGYENSITFFNKHASSFLKIRLLKYDFNLRIQYSYAINDSLKYWVQILREENRLAAAFRDNGFEIFAKEFKIPIDTALKWDRLKLTADDTQYQFELESYEHPEKILNGDTLKGDIKTTANYSIPKKWMDNPIKYFENLDKERIAYGIVGFRKLPIGGIVELNFSPTDYLLYFPPGVKIEEKQFQDFWIKKVKEGKKLSDHWYYYKREQPLDNG